MIRLRGSSANAAKPELARILCSASIKENCIKNAPSYMVQSVRPVSTASPFCTFTDVTVPSCGAQISFSIFIASRMNNTSCLLYTSQERHIRGGMATREKYRVRSEKKQDKI